MLEVGHYFDVDHRLTNLANAVSRVLSLFYISYGRVFRTHTTILDGNTACPILVRLLYLACFQCTLYEILSNPRFSDTRGGNCVGGVRDNSLRINPVSVDADDSYVFTSTNKLQLSHPHYQTTQLVCLPNNLL